MKSTTNYVHSKSSQFVIALTGHRKVTAANNGESTQRTTNNNCSFTAHGEVQCSLYSIVTNCTENIVFYNYSIIERRV
jgi:hypothetical protein